MQVYVLFVDDVNDGSYVEGVYLNRGRAEETKQVYERKKKKNPYSYRGYYKILEEEVLE